MRFLLGFALVVFFYITSNAQFISEQDAQKYASRFMSNETGKDIQMHKYSYTSKDYNRFFFFTNEDNSSFTVISKSKQAFPIIAFSTESGFSEPMPISVESYFDWIDDQLENIDTTPAIYNQSVIDAWESLEISGFLPQTGKNVSALLTTTWDQGCYYNEDVPAEASGPCGHCWAGCVATAMAQVMNYHSYPETGQGSHMYGTGLYPNLSADFGATTYLWDSMPNSISSSNAYIAEMLYHLGVAVNMDYSATGSGASTVTARDAMVDYFKYSDYCFHAEKDDFQEVDWIYLIENELYSRRPLLYRGTGSGGHAFVLDGMQNSNLFHFNWGWSGAYNGYFTLSNLRPGGGDFTTDQAAIFALEPAETDIVYCNEYNTLTALSDTISDGSGEFRYGNSTSCKWTIQPPGAGLIYINFLELATEMDGDFVSIYQGTSASDPLIAQISGFDIPQEILVWGPSAYITFYSNSMMRADGFKLVYSSCQVSIEEAWNNDLLNIYPNPADDIFTLDIDSRIDGLIEQVELMNNNGQIISKQNLPEDHAVFNVEDLPVGIYFLRLSGKNEAVVKPIEIF